MDPVSIKYFQKLASLQEETSISLMAAGVLKYTERNLADALSIFNKGTHFIFTIRRICP